MFACRCLFSVVEFISDSLYSQCGIADKTNTFGQINCHTHQSLRNGWEQTKTYPEF